VEGTLNGVVLLIMKRTFNDFPAGLKRDSSLHLILYNILLHCDRDPHRIPNKELFNLAPHPTNHFLKPRPVNPPHLQQSEILPFPYGLIILD
jgi:hypothetical protein